MISCSARVTLAALTIVPGVYTEYPFRGHLTGSRNHTDPSMAARFNILYEYGTPQSLHKAVRHGRFSKYPPDDQL